MIRILLVALLLWPISALAELEFESARIKNLPPTVPVRAGYVTLYNPGASAVSIVAAESAAFASVEFHRSVMQDGMMRMEPVDAIEVPAGGRVELEPGGLHLMLMQPVEPTVPGQSVDLTLKYADGSRHDLTFIVIE